MLSEPNGKAMTSGLFGKPSRLGPELEENDVPQCEHSGRKSLSSWVPLSDIVYGIEPAITCPFCHTGWDGEDEELLILLIGSVENKLVNCFHTNRNSDLFL